MSSSSAGSSRSPTATRCTATPRGPARHAALGRVQRRAAHARRRRGVGDYVPGLGRLPSCAAEATSGRGSPVAGHRPRGRRRSLRQHALGDAERRLAAELAGHPGARLAARHARADVLARGGAPLVAGAGNAAADDALPRARAPRRRAVPRVGNARRRPAGAVGAARVPPPRRSRHEPPGGDRRARVPHRSPHLVVLPARLAPKSLALESRFDSRTIADLQRRGHDVSLWPAWSAGRVTAVAREPDGLLRAGANPRGMQGYAVGR